MNGRYKATRSFHILTCLLVLMAGIVAPTSQAAKAQPIAFGDPAFADQWNYSDKAVSEVRATRSWIWGPTSHGVRPELMSGSPAHIASGTHEGYHFVQYFDKGRMEFAPNPDGRTGMVRNGRLVVEMMSGNVQTGLDNQYFPIRSSEMPIAGGPGGSNDTPNYASLLSIAPIENIAAPATEMSAGTVIRATYNRSGVIDALRSDPVDISLMPKKETFYKPTSDPRTWHNIPDVFWTFLNQTGTGNIWRSGGYAPGELPLFGDWVDAMGLPITEPYWTQVLIGSTPRWILFQAFERRTLTYNPFNEFIWRVEMGNAGSDYYNWRPDPLRRADPLEALVLQSSTNGTARVCPAFSGDYISTPPSTPCSPPGLMDPLAAITALHPRSWAETHTDGWMLLQTDSALYDVRHSTKLVFGSIDNSVNRLIEPDGRVDHVHAPRGRIEVKAGEGLLTTIGTRFSVIVTATAQVGEAQLGIVVPSNGGRVTLQFPSPGIGLPSLAPIIVQSGQVLTVIKGPPVSYNIDPISTAEEQYWAEKLNRLRSIPGLEEIIMQSEVLDGPIATLVPPSNTAAATVTAATGTPGTTPTQIPGTPTNTPVPVSVPGGGTNRGQFRQ